MLNKSDIVERCTSSLAEKCFFCPFMMHESECSIQALMNTVCRESEADWLYAWGEQPPHSDRGLLIGWLRGCRLELIIPGVTVCRVTDGPTD